MESSKDVSQYLLLWTPSLYAWANLDSELRAAMAAENWAMGWRWEGKLLSMATTWEGNSALEAQSADRARTCSSEGMSPVTRSQKRPSGRGSCPPGALLLAEGLDFFLDDGDLLREDSLEVGGAGGIAALRDGLAGGGNQFLLACEDPGTGLSEEGHGVAAEKVEAV